MTAVVALADDDDINVLLLLFTVFVGVGSTAATDGETPKSILAEDDVAADDDETRDRYFTTH